MRESMVVGKVYGRGLPGPTDGKSVAQNNPVLVNHPNTVDIGRAKDLTPEADAQIDDMFEYHKWAEEQVASGKHIREALAHAVKKIREARMDANSAITHGGKY
jgi:hypothetical protein